METSEGNKSNDDHNTWPSRKMHGPCGVFICKAIRLFAFGSLTEDLVSQMFSNRSFLGPDCAEGHIFSHGFQILLFLSGAQKKSRLQCHSSRDRSTKGVLTWLRWIETWLWRVWSFDDRPEPWLSISNIPIGTLPA